MPLPVRLAFAALGALSPALAARAGEQLFFRPRRHAVRAAAGPLARAEPFVVPCGGERLRAWRLGEGPPVLLVHGWSGRASQLAPFVEPLVAAGCAAVAFDLPAHGSSTGRLTSGVAFAEAISAVAARVHARAAIAHSLGGAGLAWALAGGLALDAAVLVAPPRGPTQYFHRFCDALALRPEVRDATRARMQRRLGVRLEEFDLARLAGPTPLLVFHDRDDREVPWSDGEAIARAWSGASLVTTRGLGHRRILGDAGVAARATSFVVERLARCGSCGRPALGPAEPPTCGTCAFERELWDVSGRWVRA